MYMTGLQHKTRKRAERLLTQIQDKQNCHKAKLTKVMLEDELRLLDYIDVLEHWQRVDNEDYETWDRSLPLLPATYIQEGEHGPEGIIKTGNLLKDVAKMIMRLLPKGQRWNVYAISNRAAFAFVGALTDEQLASLSHGNPKQMRSELREYIKEAISPRIHYDKDGNVINEK